MCLSAASAVTAAVSSATWSRESKPAPLVLPCGTVSEETKSAPVVSSFAGAHEDSSMPSTPLTDPVTSRRQPTTFEVLYASVILDFTSLGLQKCHNTWFINADKCY